MYRKDPYIENTISETYFEQLVRKLKSKRNFIMSESNNFSISYAKQFSTSCSIAAGAITYCYDYNLFKVLAVSLAAYCIANTIWIVISIMDMK